MSKYFHQCNYHFIPEQVKNDLLHIAKTADNFYKNISPKGLHDGNNLMRVPLDSFPLIAEMVENCQFKTVALLYKHLPHVKVPRHTDGLRHSVPRRTTLIIPLSPKKDYPPTYFWESYESTGPADIVRVDENMFPYVITTQEIHSLTNTTDEIRSNLQFSFDETLEQVVEHVKNRTLFKDFTYE
jgi:hypothetical protein